MFSSHALTPRFWSQKRDKEKKSNEIFQGLGWIFRLARERDERAFETPETTGRSCESPDRRRQNVGENDARFARSRFLSPRVLGVDLFCPSRA